MADSMESRKDANVEGAELGVILFDGYANVDVFGPVETIGLFSFVNPKHGYKIKWYSLKGGPITNLQNAKIETEKFETIGKTNKQPEVILIPGGLGADIEVENEDFIRELKRISDGTKFTLGVCNGQQLLAKAGILDGKKATTNKMAFSRVAKYGPNVEWVKEARWVRDGKLFTSSGMSAGIDMALGFVKEIHDAQQAADVAKFLEYVWADDRENDPFFKYLDQWPIDN